MATKNRIDLQCEDCQVKGDSVMGKLCHPSLENLSSNKTCTTYKKGQVIFHEDTRPLGIFCINSGKVKIYKTGTEGKDQIIQILKEGDLIGYKSMLCEEHYPVTAETLEVCNICFIPKSDFMTVLGEDSDLSKLLLKKLSHDMGVMADSLTQLAQQPVRECLAAAMVMLHETYKKNDNDQPVEINLLREDLANIVGTATETLIRLLHDFKEEKLVESQGRKIRILNLEKLRKIANIY